MSKNTTQDVGAARVKRPERSQVVWRAMELDRLLPPDHRARIVWRFVEQQDLSSLYSRIKAVEGGVGRDAVDPRILLALWLFATIEGVASAREIERLCERDLAYIWICGEVSVNYHLISDFRTQHTELLDQILTNSVTALLHQGLVTLDRVAQDGMRVRAHAGSSSFRRRPTLETCRQEAQAHLQKLQQDQQADPAASSKRKQAALERAARERQERLAQALEELKELEQQKEEREKGSSAEARASTTDPEARKMKMGDGGYRPAYNVQFATDAKTRMIVGVAVTNQGSDRGQMAPMVEHLHQRFGHRPRQYLVDCGFATKEDITKLEAGGTQVFAPVHAADQMLARGVDPYTPKKRDTPEVKQWRARMGTDEAKQIYRERSSVAEFPNAECRNRGLQQFQVRGLDKARAVSLWQALAFNLLRMVNLGCLT
jgi:transposase